MVIHVVKLSSQSDTFLEVSVMGKYLPFQNEFSVCNLFSKNINVKIVVGMPNTSLSE